MNRHPLARAGAALRATLILAVTGTLLVAAFLQPPDPRRVALFWCCFLPAALLVDVALCRLAPRVRDHLHVVLWCLCAVLVALEVGLETMVRTHPSPLFARVDRNVERLVERRAQPPGWTFLGFPFNSDGWYDEEFAPRAEGVRRVVSISDSFVWNTVPHHLHFTTVAERLLPGCEILNMGFSATGIDVYAHLVRHHAVPLRPDVIVVNLFVGNDLHEIVQRDEGAAWRRIFDRQRLLAFRIPRRLYLVAREARRRAGERRAGERRAGERRAGERRPAAAEPPRQPFTIWPGETIPVDSLAIAFPWLDDPMLVSPTFSERSFMQIETDRARAIGHPRSLDDAWAARFFARIEEMIDAAGDVPLVLVVIPDEFQVEDALWQTITATSPTELERDRAQRILGDWFDRRGVEWIDLLPRFRAVEPLADGRRHLYHLRDTHFNRRGNEVAGRVLAEHLRRVLGE